MSKTPLERVGFLYCLFFDSLYNQGMNKKQISLLVVGIILLGGLFLYRVMGFKTQFVSVPNIDVYYAASTTNGLFETLDILSKDSKDIDGWMAFAMNRKGAGDYLVARDAWEYVVSLNPLSFVTYNNLGDLYHYFLKDYRKAEKNLLKAIEVDPQHVSGYINLHDLYRLSYKTSGDSAEKILLRGLEIIGNDIVLLSKLADYYKERGRFVEATAYYQRAADQAILINDPELQIFFQDVIDAIKLEK